MCIKIGTSKQQGGQKISSSAKLAISLADRSDVYTMKKKAQGNSAEPPVYKQLHSDTSNQASFHTKDLMSLLLNCFIGLGQFHGKPCNIEVDCSVPPSQTPSRPVNIHQQAAFKHQLAEMQAAGIINLVDHSTL